MKGPNLAAMAWRNLWRNKRRTIVTLSSIAFGVGLAVIFTGLGDDQWAETIDLAARMGGGHVTIQHPDYLEKPSLKRTIRGAAQKRRLVLGMEEVERVTSRISGQAMVATAKGSYGAHFIAIDPAKEDEDTFSLFEAVKQGKMFESADEKSILVGTKLVENLDLKLGRKVVYTMTDKEGEIVSDLAFLKGTIETGTSLDNAVCVLPLERVRKVLGYDENETLHIAVFIGDHRLSDEVASRLNAHLGDRAAARMWRETQPDLAGFVAMKVGGVIFFEIIILILVAAGIFNTLFVSVMERMREFGIMTAIGFSPGRLFRLVMWESLWLGVVGLVASVVVTAGPYWYWHTRGMDFTAMMGGAQTGEVAGVGIDSIMHISIYPENAVYIAVIVLAATIAAGLYPAWRAGRVVPVETIKLV